MTKPTLSEQLVLLRAVEVAIRRTVARMDAYSGEYQIHCTTCRNALHDIANELEKLECERVSVEDSGARR